MTDFNRLFNDHSDHEGFAIDTPEPPGTHWFEVTNPFANNVAKRVGPKRAMQTPAQKNAQRRESRRQAKASPYVQVSLQHDRDYQKKLKAILKG